MEQLGKVAEWNGDRGYGFVQPLEAGLPRVFFHVREYRQDGRRPEAGELVRYRARRQEDGRWRADAVRRAVAPRRREATAPTRSAKRTGGGDAWAVWLAVAAHLVALGWALQSGRLQPLVPLVLLCLCCAAWIACVLDKHAARHGRWRIPESTLHLLELLGGWPGAAAAQQVLRHKTRKLSYRVGFWLAVLANAAVFWGRVLGLF
ncbi:DUF1294 domain-containing protein [Pseudoxanthomonas suwonensis]|uniref:DUF1294 domain-containing protein n=1 Tax=Pseudoxanthomonas suwonensis TaxID=314722 RepID=UPI0004657A5C|nr:DUF1294 domain-containing protein [Pseudoxanthomonas suwonensis]